jgi:hypothetical protein
MNKKIMASAATYGAKVEKFTNDLAVKALNPGTKHDLYDELSELLQAGAVYSYEAGDGFLGMLGEY